MSELKTGDKCTLNSGGPVMTVVEIIGNEIECKWFNEDGFCDTHIFTKACLTSEEDAVKWGLSA